MKNLLKKFSASVVLLGLLFLMSAALVPKGAVPEVEPLQPLPEFTKPNVEQSLSRNAETLQNGNPEQSEEVNQAEEKEAPAVNSVAQPEPEPIEQGKQSLLLWVVIGGLFIVLVLVVLGIRHHYTNNNSSNE